MHGNVDVDVLRRVLKEEDGDVARALDRLTAAPPQCAAAAAGTDPRDGGAGLAADGPPRGQR